MKILISNYNDDCTRKVSVKIDEDDTISLFSTLAQIIVPALERFREDVERTGSHPVGTPLEDWKQALDAMIKAFRLIKEDKIEKREDLEIQKGLNLFAFYYMDLWY